MFRTELTAKIGFTRLLDRTCPSCGGLYSSYEYAHCPKCQAVLVIPMHPAESGARPYCLTEVTLYPKMRKEDKDAHATRTKAAKGLLYTFRVILWGRYDKERNVVEPDARTRYLVPKRTIRVALYNPPTLIPFTAKDGTQKIEMKYVFSAKSGDQIELLDEKQESSEMMAGAKTKETPTQTNTSTPVDMSAVQAQLNTLMEAFKQAGGVLPAPNPEKAAMTMSGAEDYVPNAETMAAEVGTNDPFLAQ